jgi:hypothetical protein
MVHYYYYYYYYIHYHHHISARINLSKFLLFADDLKINRDIKSVQDCKALQADIDSVNSNNNNNLVALQS